MFDSLPGAIQPSAAGGVSTGYQVTEEGNEDEDDAFTSINTIPQAYAGTYGFVRSAAPQPADPFGVALQSTVQTNHDPFAASPQPTAFSGLENFAGGGQSNAFGGLPAQGVLSNAHAPPEFASAPISPETLSGFEAPGSAFVGNDIGGTASLSDVTNDDTPVSYSREAGIQQTVKTGGIETLVY